MNLIRYSVTAITSRFHRGDRGSTPRIGVLFLTPYSVCMGLGATFQQSITLSYLNCPSAKEKAVGLLYAIYTLYAVFTPEIAFINVNARFLLWVEKVALLFLSKRYDAPPHKKTFLLHSIRSIEAVFGTSDFIKLLGAN